jgi:chromosome segregation ATPase
MKFLSPILAVFLVVFASAGQVSAQKTNTQPVGLIDSINTLNKLLRDTSNIIKDKEKQLAELKDKYMALLEENKKLSSGSTNSGDNIAKLKNNIKTLENNIESLEKKSKECFDKVSILREQLGIKTDSLNQILKDLNTTKSDLKNIKNDYGNCKTKLEVITTENTNQKNEITDLQKNLSALMEQKIQSVKSSVEMLTSGSDFVLSKVDPQKKSIESEIGSLRKVADSDLSAQLDFMTNKLNDFYSACKALDFAAGVLNNDLNKIKINEALDGLSNVLSKTSVKGFQSEHNRYHTLLRDYCKNYDEASKYSKFIDYQLETKEEKLNQIRIAKGKFASYPYILDQFRKKEASLSYKMLFNAKCN